MVTGELDKLLSGF